MLPDAYDSPALLTKAGVRFTVSLDIAVELPRPPLLIVLRPRRVQWATMPKAAVYEDCDATFREEDVGTPTRHAGQRCINSEPVASAMERPPYAHLRGSVAPTLAPHSGTHIRSRWGRGCGHASSIDHAYGHGLLRPTDSLYRRHELRGRCDSINHLGGRAERSGWTSMSPRYAQRHLTDTALVTGQRRGSGRRLLPPARGCRRQVW